MPAKNWPPPGFPLVEGELAVTAEWKLHLPEQFARRIEDGSMVLWRPGLTFWLSAWGNDNGESHAMRLKRAKQESSPASFDIRDSSSSGVTLFSYRLLDESEDGPVESINTLAFSDAGELQLSAYFDDAKDESEAWRIVESVAVR